MEHRMEQTTILTILTLITLICACSYLSMCLWNPHTVSDRAALESVQRRAARWVCGSRWSPVQKHWSKSSDVCLQELRWPTLSSLQNYLSVSMMYDILHGRYDSLTITDYCSLIPLVPGHIICLLSRHNSPSILTDFLLCEHCILWNSLPHDILTLSTPKF